MSITIEQDDWEQLHEDLAVLQAERDRLRAALQYIVDHAWSAELPKWGNEFVYVAREALKGEENRNESNKS